MFQSEMVPCETCEGSGKIDVPAKTTPNGYVWPAQTWTCSDCDEQGMMEIRKSEKTEWSSKCSRCAGQGFFDLWNHVENKHEIFDCETCKATGGILYLKPVEVQ